MRYRYRTSALIYGIVCETTGMIYFGSAWDAVRRFRQHLITGQFYNTQLKADIALNTLASITVYIFTKVNLPQDLSKLERKAYLRSVEQEYIKKCSSTVLYNPINSVAKSPDFLILVNQSIH